MFIKHAIMIGLIMVFTSVGFAQMYRYTDENGNLRFTDDLTRVPQSQRENLESLPMIKSQPVNNVSEEKSEDSETWEIDLRNKAKELDQTKADLDSIFNELTEKKIALQAEAPPENASRSELSAYRDKVAQLNAEIEAYQKRREAFADQIEEFNSRLNP